ncbi:MAG TPA: hypothetical protein VMR33_16255 [Candidatus Baltobacteraceae bacterium]|jgi:hypothetical protein|nr:hypothetical protein [Candidatus Baltobacteraceae bacterium]
MHKLIDKLKSAAESAVRLCQGAVKALDETAEIVADKICATVEGVNWKRAATAVAGVGTAVLSGVSAHAQSSGGSGTTFADPSTITTTATTVFTAVATLMVGIVGFWVVLKIVRKISGK